MLADDAHYFEETINISRVKKLLDNAVGEKGKRRYAESSRKSHFIHSAAHTHTYKSDVFTHKLCPYHHTLTYTHTHANTYPTQIIK